MLTIAKLLGKSPFAPLQTHLEKVSSCLLELPPLFDALLSRDLLSIQEIARKISSLEHEADLTKNDIRNHLPKSLFLQIDRATLLDILSLQDALADQAERIALQAQMREIPFFFQVQELFTSFCSKSLDSFWLVRKVMKEFEELLGSSFGGLEAQKVKGMVEQIAYSEYETKTFEHELTQTLYRKGDDLPNPVFYLSLTLIQEIGNVARLSEQLGNRIRMLLEIK